jgi:opacity protein-like surface antigen
VAWAASDTNWDDDSFDTISERTQVVAAYSYPVSETVSLGYSFGWIDDKFQSRDIFNYPMGDGYRHTLGAQWRQSSDWTFGTSLHYGYGDHHALFGPGIKTKSETESYGADLGVQYALENNATLAFGADYRHLSSEGDVIASIPANIVGGNENGNIFNLRAGYEHPINDQWALRAGYRYAGLESYKYNRRELNELNGSAAYHAVALGAGVKFPITSKYVRSINLDYGVEYRTAAEGDWQHLVTVSVPFGICS